MKYTNAMRGIIETTHGVYGYGDECWGFCSQRATVGESVDDCDKLGWLAYRVLDNVTGEIIEEKPKSARMRENSSRASGLTL